MGYYLSAQELQNLHRYKYSGTDKSLISRYILNPFWNWFVTLWPKTVAPNTITLLGLCMVFVNFATLLYYDPTYLVERDGMSEPPWWIYYTWAAGLFLYQSFDAIDGKQARRTGMAGPLGEMFDHGCDAINTTLEVILCARALNLGRSWWTIASQVATVANFYLTTWEEYHTGTLYLGNFSGPVEGILMIVAIYIVSGTYGPQFWDTGILTFSGIAHIPWVSKHVPDPGLNEAFMSFGAVALLYNIVGSYWNVINARLTRKETLLTPLLGLIPFIVTVGLQLFWLHAPLPNPIVKSAWLLPFLLAWGLQFAHQVGRLILAHVSKTPFPYWDWMWPWTLAFGLDANAQWLFDRPPLFQSSPAYEEIAVGLTLLVSFIYYAQFCTLVIWDITEYLGIACFSVQKKDAEGDWKPAGEVDKKGN